MDYNYTLFARSYYSAQYNKDEVLPYIEEQIQPLIDKSEFYWEGLFDFYATYHFWKQRLQCPSYLSLDKIEEIMKDEKIDANWVDKGGNHFLNFLCTKTYEARDRDNSKVSLMLFKDDIYKAVKIVKNPLLKNNKGINFFWNLSNVSFAGIEPSAKLLPIIKKYKINIFEPINNGRDLLDKAVSTGWGVHIDFYLKQGLKIEGREHFLENFISFPINNEKVMRNTYQAALKHYDPFNKLYYRETGYDEKENLISLWTSFLSSSREKSNYADNLLFTLDLINKGEVKIESKNYKVAKKTLTSACKMLTKNIHFIRCKKPEQAQKIIDACIPSLERQQLDKGLKTNTITANSFSNYRLNKI